MASVSHQKPTQTRFKKIHCWLKLRGGREARWPRQPRAAWTACCRPADTRRERACWLLLSRPRRVFSKWIGVAQGWNTPRVCLHGPLCQCSTPGICAPWAVCTLPLGATSSESLLGRPPSPPGPAGATQTGGAGRRHVRPWPQPSLSPPSPGRARPPSPLHAGSQATQVKPTRASLSSGAVTCVEGDRISQEVV